MLPFLFIVRSFLPSAPLFIATKPVTPSSARARFVADVHPLRFEAFRLPWALAFFDTMLPFLFIVRSFLVRPPLVNALDPIQTCRIVPVCETLVALRADLAFLLARDFLGLDALRAETARPLGVSVFIALRTAVLTAILGGQVWLEVF